MYVNLDMEKRKITQFTLSQKTLAFFANYCIIPWYLETPPHKRRRKENATKNNMFMALIGAFGDYLRILRIRQPQRPPATHNRHDQKCRSLQCLGQTWLARRPRCREDTAIEK